MIDGIAIYILFGLMVLYTAVMAWLNFRDPPER